MSAAKVVLCLIGAAAALDMTANPIRKVVTLLQDMSKEIEAEGAKEKELFDKFMCFCNGNTADMEKSVADAKSKIEELAAKVESEKAEKVQLTQDLVAHKADKAAAIDDLSKAESLRAKEKSEYDASYADQTTNLASLSSALPALEKGMAGSSFVQMPEAKKLRALVEMSKYTNSYDRNLVISFMEQSGDYVPASGQIVGILKGMKDEMEAAVKELTSSEEAAAKGYGELKAAKESEEAAASKAIETKTARAGELAVSIVQSEDGLEDTTKEMADTEKFLATLAVQCKSKQEEWAARQKLRAEEVEAISQAVGILNDDDALDVFKKAVPASLSQTNEWGFLQARNSRSSKLLKAQALITSVTQIYRSRPLQLLAYSMSTKLRLAKKAGNTADFSEIMKMIDAMVEVLTKEGADDEKHKAFCTDEFESSADKMKDTKDEIAGLEAAISELTDESATLTEDIATLTKEIAALDKAVATATEQRKEEHADYTQTLALSETAIELIAKAKNRLQKFYNPTLYKAPPKVESTMEEKIIDAGSYSFFQKRSAVHQPEAPETFGFYQKKSEKSGGVMALMDMITKELETDMKDSEYDEKSAQKEYSELMAESQETRASDTKSITEKEASKATLEGKIVEAKESKTLSVGKLEEINNYIFDLHGSCDFIMENFDMRKEARTNEMESLKNAKAILAGASFGF
jgi:septal ring factor EnvC (AmiA/AmiB activator)